MRASLIVAAGAAVAAASTATAGAKTGQASRPVLRVLSLVSIFFFLVLVILPPPSCPVLRPLAAAPMAASGRYQTHTNRTLRDWGSMVE